MKTIGIIAMMIVVILVGMGMWGHNDLKKNGPRPVDHTECAKAMEDMKYVRGFMDNEAAHKNLREKCGG